MTLKSTSLKLAKLTFIAHNAVLTLNASLLCYLQQDSKRKQFQAALLSHLLYSDH